MEYRLNSNYYRSYSTYNENIRNNDNLLGIEIINVDFDY